MSEPWFTPEVGRARACGAKDASDSFHKVTRALRLTFMLQKTVADTVRDLRGGDRRARQGGRRPSVMINPRGS